MAGRGIDYWIFAFEHCLFVSSLGICFCEHLSGLGEHVLLSVLVVVIDLSQ